MITMTYDEFVAEMKKQNVPIEDVTFECPHCKTLQSGNDLIAAGVGRDFDAVKEYLGFACIGRWSKDKGCDWSLGGLLRIHELEVVTDNGKHHPRFLLKST